jgi:hypothetical protein
VLGWDCAKVFLKIAILLSLVVVFSILIISLVLAVVIEGLLLGVIWCWCLCLVNGLVLVVRVSSDLTVTRWARNML